MSKKDLQELSKKTLGNYIKKAQEDSKWEAFDIGGISNETGGIGKYKEKTQPKFKKLANRTSGISKAVDKLTKEDIESLDEAGFSNPLSPLVKGKSDSGYMRHGKSWTFSSSNPDMRINRRAGLDKKIHWDTDENPNGSDKGHQERKNSLKRIERKKMSMKESIDSVELSDLIKTVLDSKPSEFKDVFDTIITSKLNDLIDGKKDELAASMFKEDVEQIDELVGKGNLEKMRDHYDKEAGKHSRLSDHNYDRFNKSGGDSYYQKSMEHETKRDENERKEYRAKGLIKLRNVAADYRKAKKDYSSVKNKLKEDVEQIDELSKTTLKNYIKKAITSSNRAHEKGDKEEDKASSTNADKYPEKFKKHNSAAAKQHDIADRRDTGITLAKSKISGAKERGHWFGPDRKAKILASKKTLKKDLE